MEKLRRKFEKYKKGFTLAEVLITLVIVGVVAALTIPNLINKTNHKEYASKLKKAYSILQQFVHASAMQKGEPQGDYSFFNNYDFINEFAKTVNVAKNVIFCRNVLQQRIIRVILYIITSSIIKKKLLLREKPSLLLTAFFIIFPMTLC